MRVGATWRLIVPDRRAAAPGAAVGAAGADDDGRAYIELRLRSVALAGPAGARFGTASLRPLRAPPLTKPMPRAPPSQQVPSPPRSG